MPPSFRKDDYRHSIGFDHLIPQRTPKQRRPEVCKPDHVHGPMLIPSRHPENRSSLTRSSWPCSSTKMAHCKSSPRGRCDVTSAIYSKKPSINSRMWSRITSSTQVRDTNRDVRLLIASESKRHRTANYSPLSTLNRDPALLPYARKPAKRRYPDAMECVEQPLVLSSHRKEPPRQLPRGDRLIAIRIDDTEAQAKWFSDAFKAVQQVACRTIAKVWIKKIHPKKVNWHKPPLNTS